jgi:predicted membrane-bound mannosyltransferase
VLQFTRFAARSFTLAFLPVGQIDSMVIEEQPTTDNERKSPDYVWLVSCALITAVATFLRFYWLGLKPFHHDEGVNGFFLTNLFRDGVYKYDPANYHGPTLYYISLAFAEVFGLETIPIRWSVAIWGVLIVILAFFLKGYIGKTGALFAALFLALSPGMVFISRYFIHEIFFVFLCLAFVVAILFFIEKEKAGPFAIGWMALILFVCFAPTALKFAPVIAGENVTALWAARIGFFLVEAVLVYFVIRMLMMWNDGRPIYMLLAAACVALLFATKETTFITLGTMLIACLCIWAREMITESAAVKKFPATIFAIAEIVAIGAVAVLSYKLPDVGKDFGKRTFDLTGAVSADTNTYIFYLLILVLPAAFIFLFYQFDLSAIRLKAEPATSPFYEPTLAAFREKIETGTDWMLIASASAALAVYVIVLFFSSFFTYADGVKGFYEAYAIWTKTGSKDHTQNGIWAYVDWGMRSDGPIMLLSVVGALIALIKGRHRFAMFAGLWAFGLFAAYSIIPYKTPWLALSFLLPMCISAGYAINEMIASRIVSLKAVGVVLAVAATAILAYQTYDLNFVRYDDEDAPMVYAHTQRQFLDMIREIERYANKSGKGKDTAIDIVSPDYWPMVWYMKDYPKAIFHGRIADSTAEMIVAKKGEQDSEVVRKYSANYVYVGPYALRSGVDLVLLVRKDLAGTDGKELYRISRTN